MKILLMFIFLTPTDSIPSDSILLNSIDSFYQIKESGELLQFENRESKWLDYIPNPSIVYTANGSPRVGAGYNLKQVLDIKRNRKELENKRQSVRVANFVAACQERIKLKKMLLDYREFQKLKEFELKKLEIERKVFELNTQLFESNDLTPAAYFSAQLRFISQEESVRKLEYEDSKKALEILEVAKYF